MQCAPTAPAQRPSVTTLCFLALRLTIMRGFALLSACASTLALDANVYSGAWEVVGGSLGIAPTQSYGHAAWVPGYLAILGNDTSQSPAGSVDLWTLNIVQNKWANPFDYPGSWPTNPTGYPPQPFIFTSGGTVLALDELAPNNLFALDSIAQSGTWRTIPVTPPTPLGSRWGQRFLSWGSSLFMYGGITASTPQTFRTDLWAMQLTATLNSVTVPLPGWNLVSSTDPSTGLTPGFPPGRIGPSWTGYTIGAMLYGGVATRDGSAPYPKCFVGLSPSTPAPPECFFHHHVWVFLPGATDWWVPDASSNAQKYGTESWIMLNDVGANGGPVPAGRTEHCAGNLGDQLYIYGGFTATGPVSASDALWTYNIISQTWSNLPAGNPSPTVGSANIVATGTFIARHLYIYLETYTDATQSTRLGGQLWRWAPNTALPAPPAPPPYNSSGHTAGIVIGILIGLANLYYLHILVQNAGVDVLPAWAAALVPASLAGCMGGGKPAAPGYYSSAPTAVAQGGYAPPP